MQQLKLNRRQFMQVTLSAAVAWGIGQSANSAMAPSQHPLLDRLATLLPHQQSARSIGHWYLQQYPQEAHIDQLLAALPAALQTADVADLQRQLAQQIKADFTADQIVKVQGWLLARTEARLCALTAML